MLTKISSTRSADFLALVILASLFLISGLAEAKNANLSFWTLNLSESEPVEETGYRDYAPEIVVVGSTVHVMWITDSGGGAAPYYLYYKRSTDGGKTWEPKKLLFENNGAINNPTYRKMAVDGNTIHIFQDHHSGVLTYFRSIDNGATFEPPRDVVTGDWWTTDVYASAGGGKVTVGYRYSRNFPDVGHHVAPQSIIALTSEDGGATFTSYTVASSAADIAFHLYDLKMDGDKIYMLIVYGHEVSSDVFSNELYLAASTDRGVTFTSTLLSIPSSNGRHETPMMQDFHYVPKIASAGNNVYVVWCGLDGQDIRSLFYRRSTDNGVTFEPIVNLSKDVLPANRDPRWGLETIAAKGNYVYVVFVVVGHGYAWWNSSSNPMVHVRRSTDSGASFQELQDIETRGGWWPVVRTDPTDASGATVHVLWSAIGYSYSSDGGATFTGPVGLAPQYSLRGSHRSQMAIGDDGALHWVAEESITWYSTGVFGDSDIFYRRLERPAPPPSPENMALHVETIRNAGDGTGIERFDNMQIAATADTNFTSAMTAEAWIKPAAGSPRNMRVLVKAETPNQIYTPKGYQLATHDWSNGRWPNAGIRTTAGEYVNWGGELIPDDRWTHMAMSYDPNGGTDNFRLYVNGNLSTAQTVTGTLTMGIGTLLVGGDLKSNTNQGFTGDIDEVRLWDHALTQAEIEANMRKPLRGNEPGLTAYYNFNNTTKDMTEHGNDGVLMYKESFVPSDAVATELPAAKRTLSITSTEASPGAKATVQLTITDATGLTAGDILVKYDASVLTVGEVKGTDLILDINLIVNKDVQGEIKLSLAGMKGIPSGSGALVEIELTVSKDAKVGTETTLSFSDTEIYDESGAVIPVILENGVVKITQAGIKGDVNNDGKVRSNDAMLALRIAAGLMVPSDYQKWAADMNDDGKIRSNDAMLILRKAAGLAAPDIQPAVVGSGTITVMLGEAHGVAGERITAPLMVDNVYDLASGDICIAYDSAVLRAVKVTTQSGVTLQSNIAESGMVRIAFASVEGLNSKTVAEIQFDILADDVSSLTLQQVELYQSDALLVDSRKIDGLFSSWAIPPEHSALLQNFPNPFNPETWIPYQLAEGGDVTIRIYNVKGQLIKTLELGYQPAGIYTHRSRAAYWDGKNEKGDRVASGVYFYQLHTGQFTAMRKLILLK